MSLVSEVEVTVGLTRESVSSSRTINGNKPSSANAMSICVICEGVKTAPCLCLPAFEALERAPT